MRHCLLQDAEAKMRPGDSGGNVKGDARVRERRQLSLIPPKFALICRSIKMQKSKEGERREGPSQRHLREERGRGTEEEERRGPSNLINEINLSAIFGGKVGKGKRGENGDRTDPWSGGENAKLQTSKKI